MKNKVAAAVIVVAAVLIMAAVSGASITSGCDAKQWGTGTCWAPGASAAPRHTCPDFNDHNTVRFDEYSGSYQGFVKIRSTVSCRAARRLILDWDVDGFEGFYRLDGSFWTPGIGYGTSWRRRSNPELLLVRGFHVARTNWLSSQTSAPNPLYLEHDLVTWTIEELWDCRKVPEGVHCTTVTPAFYRDVPK